jgi:hypothetical protein
MSLAELIKMVLNLFILLLTNQPQVLFMKQLVEKILMDNLGLVVKVTHLTTQSATQTIQMQAHNLSKRLVRYIKATLRVQQNVGVI